MCTHSRLKLMQTPNLTQSGTCWLNNALDPYSDYQQERRGYCDSTSLPSVVQVFNSQATVTVPAGVVGNYDCSVNFTGLDAYSATNMCNAISPASFATYDSGAAAANSISSVTICTAASGTALNLYGVGVTKTMMQTRQVSDCPGRLIGIAFEVHNTTAEIYKQGTLVCCRPPSVRMQQSSVTAYDSNFTNDPCSFTTTWLPLPPNTISAARSVPDSSQWKASEGCYCIPRLNTEVITPGESHIAQAGVSLIGVAGAVTSAQALHSYPTVLTQTVGVAPSPLLKGFQPIFTRPLVSSFTPLTAFFGGLSNESTLTVNLRAIVEYFPPPGHNLLTSAKPSAMYDPTALQVYSATCYAAPYAVPVGQNDAGDYFRKVLSAMSKIAPYAAVSLKPFAPGASFLVSTGGKMAALGAQRIKARQQKKKGKRNAVPNYPAPKPPRPKLGRAPNPPRINKKVAGNAANANL